MAPVFTIDDMTKVVNRTETNIIKQCRKYSFRKHCSNGSRLLLNDAASYAETYLAIETNSLLDDDEDWRRA